MQSRIHGHLLRQLGVAILSTFCLSSAHSSTPLTEWAITATTGITNTGSLTNFFTGFTATQVKSGPTLYVGSPTSPANTWNRTYTNSPNPIPYSGLAAISQGNYFAFDTVISAGWNVNVDAISNLFLGKTASAATNAALYYSVDNGAVWKQAGGTVTLPLSTGINDSSTSVNTGTGTNKYVTGGVTNIITNLGLTTSPIYFDNSANTNQLTVNWALALWGAGNGRIGFSNGGNLLTLSGNIVAIPEASTNALFCLGIMVLVIAYALIRVTFKPTEPSHPE